LGKPLGRGANNLGSNPLLENAYQYFDWSQEGGRLHILQSGTYTDTTFLQNLVYDYDDVGNVNSIEDYNAGNPQTQSFNYDSLNRLINAQASSGNGEYPQEIYSYNTTTGNPSGRASGRGLASKAGVSYGYNDGAHAHAVTHLGGVQKYWYRCHIEQPG
jgi:hypothetical protein